MVQHWTDHRIPFAQNENVSPNWLAGPLYNQDEGWHGSHMPKAFLKKTQVEGTTPEGPGGVSRCSCTLRVSLFTGIAQKQATKT